MLQPKNWRLMTKAKSAPIVRPATGCERDSSARDGRPSRKLDGHAPAVHRVNVQLVAAHERHPHEWHPISFVYQDGEQHAVPEDVPLIDIEDDNAPVSQDSSPSLTPG